MKKILTSALMIVALVATGTACSEYNDERGKGDAPVANQKGDDSPKSVTNNPDGFANVVTGCLSGAPGWRYATTTHGSSAAPGLVVVADPACNR